MTTKGRRVGSVSPPKGGGTSAPKLDHIQDIKLRVTANIKDANRSLKELERQVDKIGDLADQGQHRQSGFLSPKQVNMYKNIMREIEAEYSKHQRRLQQIEQEFEQRKLKAQKEANRRKKDLDEAVQRGVVDGNPLTQSVYNHYKKKYDEADAKASSIENDGTIKGEISGLKASIQDLEQELQRSRPEASRINNMHQQSPEIRNLTNGITQVLAQAGAVMSVGALLNYTSGGAQLLRHDEYRNSRIGQKIGYGNGTDSDLRDTASKVGEKNQYNAYETSVAQTTLVRGGYSDLKMLGKDTETIQQFGRAYAVDPNEIGQDGAMLKRMGALKDGDMQKFANLIGGSISKTKMSGREEEMMRSTTTLVSAISTKIVGMTDKQLGNIIGLQTSVGEAIPQLRGERGAEMLSNMDNAIKSGDNAFDILMGKGTKYVGQEGIYQLEYQKEEGLANPKNLQDFFQGIDRTGATGVEKSMMAQKIGLSLHEEKALRDAGLVDRFKSGDFHVTEAEQEQLKNAGAEDIVKHMQEWNKTKSKTQASNDAQSYNLKESTSKPYDRAAKGIMSTWHKLPDPVQSGIIWGAGLGGGMFGGSLIKRYGGSLTGKLTKLFTNNIGTAEATGRMWRTPTEILGGAFKGSSFVDRLKNFIPGIGKQATGVIDDLATGGARMATNGAVKAGATGVAEGLAGRVLSFGGKSLKFIGKSAPVIGTALDVGIDRVANPHNSWGRSITKGIFGTIGGALGLGISALAGVPTGGLGTAATIGLAGAGGMAGNKLGDSLYSKIFGDADKQGAERIEQQQQVDKLTSSADPIPAVGTTEASVDRLQVATLNVQDKSLATILDTNKFNPTDKSAFSSRPYSTFNDFDTSIKRVGSEHSIKITISGDIKGMTQQNQTEVKNSITDFWSRILPKNSGIDLAYENHFK